MIYLRQKQFVSVLALSSMLFVGAVLPAQAGTVTIHARQTGGQSLKLPFAVTCVENNGAESQAEYYSVWTGSDLEVEGCDKFAVYFRSNGLATITKSVPVGLILLNGPEITGIYMMNSRILTR